MQVNPLVSIVMPIYNVEDYIEKSVQSVIAQTYDNIELILVDDGSTDSSVQVAERVLNANSYPYKLIRQENKGLGEARNSGTRNSTGKWILFLDSDDIILDDAVKNLVYAIDDSADLAFPGFEMIKSQNEVRQTIKKREPINLTPEQIQKDFLTRKYVILAPGTLFRRELIIEKNIFFEKMPWSEDQHFMWRVLSVIKGAVYLDEPLYQYLKHPGSIMTSSSISKITVSYPEICKLPKYYDENLLVKRFLVSRWVLGTISSSAKISDFSDWNLFYKSISGNKHMRNLLHFPSVKTKVRAFICLMSPKIYYGFFAKRK